MSKYFQIVNKTLVMCNAMQNGMSLFTTCLTLEKFAPLSLADTIDVQGLQIQ